MRYSQSTIGGDARFMGMGGSFGALGANISCINYNPAGIAVYRKGAADITGSIRFGTVNATHYGNQSSDYIANIYLPAMGFVTAWEVNNPYTTESAKKHHQDWSRRHSIGISINKIANFNYNTSIEANVYNTSIVNDFVRVAEGKTNNQLNTFYEGQAWQTYLINEYPNSTTSYWGMIDPNTRLKQSKTIQTTGAMNEISLAYGYAIDNKLYLGASLGIPRIKFSSDSKHSEEDVHDSISWFKSMYYEEIVQTTGIGINLKLGAIYRVNPFVRVGFSVHTPTRISLSDSYINSMSATYDKDTSTPAPIRAQTFTFADTGKYNYTIQTPMRSTASLALLAGKYMAFNVDCEVVNYATGMLPSPSVFNAVNNEIRKKYSTTGNLRLGTEINIQPVVIRLGYAMYGSPFGNMFAGNFVRTTFSGGIGFKRSEDVYIDFAIATTSYKEDYYLYDPSLINATQLNYKNTSVLVTLGKKF